MILLHPVTCEVRRRTNFHNSVIIFIAAATQNLGCARVRLSAAQLAITGEGRAGNCGMSSTFVDHMGYVLVDYTARAQRQITTNEYNLEKSSMFGRHVFPIYYQLPQIRG